MIVWGGFGLKGYLNDGGQYDPVTDTWTPMTTTGAPAAREVPTAVWTGSRMIVWGGQDHTTIMNTGGLYDPTADTWTPTTTTGAPSPRTEYTAVWAGSRMIVWGGFDSTGRGVVNDGAQYDPATNTWTPTATTGAPSPRFRHTAVWTDSRMIVWGGVGSASYLNDGGQYDPVTNTWTPMTGAPFSSSGNTAVWTGSRMIFWGPAVDVRYPNVGGLYDPVTDTWTSMTTSGEPVARHAAYCGLGGFEDDRLGRVLLLGKLPERGRTVLP